MKSFDIIERIGPLDPVTEHGTGRDARRWGL
jgi:hypothetical protein